MSAIKSLATKDSLWTGITAGVTTFKELIQATNQKKKKKLSRTIKFCLGKKERKCRPNIAVEYTR